MKTEKKVFIKVESQEQQETTKNSRRTLKVLQQTACDKENLAGRPQSFKDAKFAGELEKPETKRKKVQMQHKAVQVGECVITADDLTWTSPVPIIGENLQKRGEALNRSLQENEKLKEDIDALKEENKICKEMLDESKHLVEILQDMCNAPDESGDEGISEHPEEPEY